MLEHDIRSDNLDGFVKSSNLPNFNSSPTEFPSAICQFLTFCEIVNLSPQGLVMLKKKIILSIIVSSLIAAPVAFAQDYIGGLRKVTGSGTIIRNDQQIIAKDGARIKMGDKLITGSNGAMGVIFTDNTRISLGSNSEINIDHYVYNPNQGAFSFLTELIQGTASYISGTIGKLSPNSVKFKTPTAVVGVRGTSFLVTTAPKK